MDLIFHHVLFAAFLFPMTSATLITQPIPAMPSPSPYSIASSTIPTKQGGIACAGRYVQPTPVPELRRRQQSLGWNDPPTCNVGVCDSGQYCTVFATESARGDFVKGVCCAKYVVDISDGLVRYRLIHLIVGEYVHLLHHASTKRRTPRAQYRWGCTQAARYSGHISLTSSVRNKIDILSYSGTSFPFCSSRYFQYGYGFGTFIDLDCWKTRLPPNELSTTILNPSWKLYAVNTNPEKGPLPTTTFTDLSTSVPTSVETSAVQTETSTSSPNLTILVPQSGGTKAIPAGTIASIAIGCIGALALCAVAVMLVWFMLRAHNPPPPPPPPPTQEHHYVYWPVYNYGWHGEQRIDAPRFGYPPAVPVEVSADPRNRLEVSADPRHR
ncbi:hypothetical protein K440DRAFT_635857 [Wilcoxina mikolae CBS 423.85]|nr:hypothetical protein K440DRAFT_635857 [Wilcoxina mikolae CBS 423.85]